MGSYTPSYHEEALSRYLQNSALFVGEAFIGGRWVKKSNTFSVIEPSSEAILGQVADCGIEDFRLAIDHAYSAQQAYFDSTTAVMRASVLQKWNNLILSNKKDLAIILSLENGKTFTEAEGEIVYASSFVSWFAEEARRSYGYTIPSSSSNTAALTLKEPVGVCGIITPWNFPAAMITRKVAPALACGCAVVIKPPSETPFTCLALTKLAIEAGLPANLIQVCPSKNREAVLELSTNSKVRKISFTGSTAVGKMLAKLAASTLKRVSLELGGNAPFIVFKDADIDLAVEGAIFCKFRCSGQTCVCANRLIVHRDIVQQFTQKLVEAVSRFVVGPGLRAATTQGPLVNRAAVIKVTEHIRDAVEKGAIIETSSFEAPDTGFFCPPTVLSGVTSDMLVAKEETFGPLAPIFTFDTEQEAICLANDTEFGLAGYFLSRDVNKIMRVAQKLQVGMVGVNTGKISAPEVPFGGVKESGYGIEGSLFGMDEYQVIKSITIGNQDR